MKDQESIIGMGSLSSNLSAPPPNSVYYGMSVHPNRRKLGTVAMKAFGDLKQLLNYGIILPPAEHLIGGWRAFRPKLRDQNQQKIADLKKAVEKSHEVLASVQTFAIFPDKVIVDRTKITIIKRNSLWSTDVISIQVEDILNVSSSVGLLFGSLTIASRVMSTTDHFQITMLWRGDAIDLKHIIQGYAIAKHTTIDTDQLSRNQMLETLRELGHDSGM